MNNLLHTAKKEAKRLEKEAKLAAKTAKGGPEKKAKGEKAEKVKKDGQESEAPFVNLTPKGEKKGPPTYIYASRRLFESRS